MPDPADEPRLYGAPDSSNRQPPAPEGLAGERGTLADPGTDDAPDRTHQEVAEGQTVTVEETSGVAFAENTGLAGSEEQRKVANAGGETTI